jgi:peptidyl-prolyl cis-trans isomerase C
MQRSYIISFGLVLLFISGACQAGGGAPGRPGTSAAAASPPAQAVPPGTVLARVNGKEIPAGQLDQTVRIYLETNAQDAGSMPADQLKSLRKQLLDSLVGSEVLFQASQAARISVPEEKVEEQIQQLRSRFSSEEEFSGYIQSQGISLTDMKERIRRNLATTELVEREVDSKIAVSDSEVADYYKKNKDRMKRDETVKLSEIFIRSASEAGPASKAKAREKIEALLKEVQSGKDFATVARTHSESPDAKRGGEMGYISRKSTLPVLADAAFRLKAGEISDVVETPFGYHILKVAERRAPGEIKMEEAKPQISKAVFQEKERAAFNTYLDRLKEGAKIEILKPDP